MKLLSVKRARAIWLFPTADINPSGKHIFPLIAELIKRYKFADVPNLVEAIKKNEGFLLKQGAYNHPKLGEIDVALSIYNDGLVADTATNTDATEEFLEDALKLACTEYKLQYPKTIRKIYLSDLYVETSKSLDALNTKLTKFCEALSNKMPKANGEIKYELGSITFTSQQKSAVVPPVFRFEREDKAPLAEKRYFSTCGLPTAEHLEMLDLFEAILG